MKKYVRFVDKATHTLTWTRPYETDEEYFEIMDNIDPDLWEIKFDKAGAQKLPPQIQEREEI